MKSFWTLGLVALTSIVISGCESMHKAGAAKTSPSTKASKSQAKASKVATSEGAVNCTFKSDSRSLENKSTANGGCEVVYTKAGNAQTVATAAKGGDYCAQVVEKMKANLVAGGWACN